MDFLPLARITARRPGTKLPLWLTDLWIGTEAVDGIINSSAGTAGLFLTLRLRTIAVVVVERSPHMRGGG